MDLTPEQARIKANEHLASLYSNISDWTEATYDQVVAAIAAGGLSFSMNDIRTVCPGERHHQAGLYFHALLMREPHLLVKVGEVRSANPKARGKKVNTYRLTTSPSRFLKIRRTERARKAEQAKARAARQAAAA
ncbi:hypothetical protein [Streptomyces sp. WM6349]|uniref:hypothetical protein n=1 Tax=Streptomyces sp. WM6349 TaxID=1415552 RepID=UPI0006AED63F|nr:hypothetical protein [Streptomyces sp. WM6349]KOU17055.1 hypothetical protein ADK49_17120 [Streptomyces sp. WM6349]